MKARIFVTFLLIAILTQVPVDAAGDDQPVESVVEGNGRVCVGLYKQIADEEGNILFYA